MTFDEMLAEMKRHADAKRNQESYLDKIYTDTESIRNVVTPDDIRSWKLIESLICSKSKISGVNEEHIRDLLKVM